MSKLFARLWLVAIDEIPCGHATFSFELELNDFKCRRASASRQKPRRLHRDLTGCQPHGLIYRMGTVNLELACPEERVPARPRLKSTKAIEDFSCSALKIDTPIFFRQNRSQRCFRVILRS